MTKAIIFDLDGTLVHSAPDLHAAINVLMGELSLSVLSLAEVSSYIGHGIPHLVEQCLAANGQLCEPVYIERFFELYAANPTAHGQVYTGAKSALETLKSEGWVLGICTNKATKMTELVVKGYGLEPLFGAVVCGDSLSQKKPDPAPLFACAKQLAATSVLYVGDSETDATTAQNAKIPFVLFTEGYRNATIDDIPHQAVFDRWADFSALVQQMGQ